jgi:amidophosphoribosyltransferase
MLREAGAAEVHVRISSPPVRWPCYYGIDFATRAELIAAGLEVEEICASIGADTLGYVSEAGMVAATAQPVSQLCTACFTGVYPVPPPTTTGKDVLEQESLFDSLDAGFARGRPESSPDVDGVDTGLDGGALAALLHP